MCVYNYMYTYRLDQSKSLVLSTGSGAADTSNDQLLAMMLQMDFDREHDLILRAEEKAYNKDSKGIYTVHTNSSLYCYN